MKLSSKHLYSLTLVVIAIIITIYTLSYMVTKPSTSLVTMGGDGIKNYYSYLYHAANGSGLHFEGMNYPYGEHIVYTDAQPLLSVPLGYISKLVPLSYNTLLAILHLSLALSFFLAIIFTYKTLIYFKIHPIYAIITSALIVLMSPQLFRIHGHFGLGYQSMVPMLFYWNIKYHDTKKIGYIILLLLLGIGCALLHPYCAALFFIWLMLYVFGYMLIYKHVRIKDRLKDVLPISIAAVSIVGFVKLFMYLTDSKIGRTEFPYGTLSGCTVGRDIFTSGSSPIWQGLFDLGIVEKTSRGEGLAYLGIVGITVVLIALITTIINTIKKKQTFEVSRQFGFSPIWLFIALGTFLLAQGVPFVWNMEWLLDYISSFRQFRTLGRFAFLFYYIVSIYAVVLLYNLFIELKKKNKRQRAYIILFFTTLLWGIEANGYIVSSRKAVENSMYNYMFVFEYYDWKKLYGYQWVNSDDFQGVILLPYVHVGSEKIWLNGEKAWVFTLGISNALQLKLPIVNVHMSRTAWPETYAQVKTIGGPIVSKPLLDTIKTDRPFLVLHLEAEKLDPDSKYLLEVADYIDTYDQISAYILSPQKLRVKDSNYRDSLKKVAEGIDAKDTCLECADYPYIVDHLDEDTVNSFYSSGARSKEKQQSSNIKTYNLKPLTKAKLYEFSFWSLVNSYNYQTPTFVVETLNDNGEVTSLNKVKAAFSVDNKEGWLRANSYFVLPENTVSLKVTVPKDYFNSYTFLDEIVFRPAEATTISRFSKKDSTVIMVNNHILDTK
ncbi:MAG: hypothetical protein R2800_10295 [Flavipsychrobacter sp.]